MIRLIHLVAIALLIGSAAYAYSTKYETLYYSEMLSKLKSKLQKEREGIAIAKAEWAMLTRPDRLQRIAEKHLDLQPMTVSQLARFADIPNKPTKDAIGQKLEMLGLEPEATSSTSPAPVKPKPAPTAAKASKPALGQPAPPKRTVQVAPPAKPAATPARPKPAVNQSPKPATSAPAAAKPATR